MVGGLFWYEFASLAGGVSEGRLEGMIRIDSPRVNADLHGDDENTFENCIVSFRERGDMPPVED